MRVNGREINSLTFKKPEDVVLLLIERSSQSLSHLQHVKNGRKAVDFYLTNKKIKQVQLKGNTKDKTTHSSSNRGAINHCQKKEKKKKLSEKEGMKESESEKERVGVQKYDEPLNNCSHCIKSVVSWSVLDKEGCNSQNSSLREGKMTSEMREKRERKRNEGQRREREFVTNCDGRVQMRTVLNFNGEGKQ